MSFCCRQNLRWDKNELISMTECDFSYSAQALTCTANTVANGCYSGHPQFSSLFLLHTKLYTESISTMLSRALSTRLQKIKQQNVLNCNLAAAVDAYQQKQLKPKLKGLHPIAKMYGVKKSTLKHAVNGEISMSAFNATKQLLPSKDEHVVVDYVLESLNRGRPFTHKELEELINELTAQRHTGDGPPHKCGVHYVECFLDRHSDEL